MTKEIEMQAAQDTRCVAIQKIRGIGPITASAIVASIGDAGVFKNGREVSAWLGLVPKQHSSGNKIRLGGISKRGDRYVRTLLVHGARSVVNICEKKQIKIASGSLIKNIVVAITKLQLHWPIKMLVLFGQCW